ncbi:MAG: Gfo/Idh/MocA family oxidoreductase [Planctomycetota bacterium]|nr:Gfo/Idh/MocA family oxidoreductase [Planctomycetota bacterium]
MFTSFLGLRAWPVLGIVNGFFVGLLISVFSVAGFADEAGPKIAVGVIGVDTPHATDFTRIMNNPKATGPLADCTVVAAYLGGSPDVPKSVDLRAKQGKLIREMGVEVVDSIELLLGKVDAVMLETLDGRPHLKEAKKVIAAKKPLFIDKPLAGSLADCVEIFKLAEAAGTPCFSSSSLRFSKGVAAIRSGNNPKIGKVIGSAAYGPNKLLVPHRMPDLFYYGIHGAETLFSIMGPGCKTVRRIKAGNADLVVGVWKNGRLGTYRSYGGFGATIYGTKGVALGGKWTGYDPLVVEIARFFRTGRPPVSHEETLEIYTFLEAADESKRHGGAPVSMESVLDKARNQVSAKSQYR